MGNYSECAGKGIKIHVGKHNRSANVGKHPAELTLRKEANRRSARREKELRKLHVFIRMKRHGLMCYVFLTFPATN